MPHSGIKPENENDTKEEDDLRWKMTFDEIRPLMRRHDLTNEKTMTKTKTMTMTKTKTMSKTFRERPKRVILETYDL